MKLYKVDAIAKIKKIEKKASTDFKKNKIKSILMLIALLFLTSCSQSLYLSIGNPTNSTLYVELKIKDYKSLIKTDLNFINYINGKSHPRKIYVEMETLAISKDYFGKGIDNDNAWVIPSVYDEYFELEDDIIIYKLSPKTALLVEMPLNSVPFDSKYYENITIKNSEGKNILFLTGPMLMGVFHQIKRKDKSICLQINNIY